MKKPRFHLNLPAGAILLAGSVLTVAVARAAAQTAPSVELTLDRAIHLAVEHNPSLKAARSQIEQSQASEITAGIRPNPVFTYDDLFMPVKPSQITGTNINNISEFDAGASFTWERGHKRQARVRAARDQTAVTRDDVSDTQRALTYNVGQQFIAALLAKSQLKFAEQDLASFRQTVQTSESQYKAGAISEGDLLKIKLQMLQFQTDVSTARLALEQALASLRQLVGYNAVPADYTVAGKLAYTPIHANKEDLQLLALKQRPDLLAAEKGVTAAQSQYALAKANGKRDLTTTFYYTHVVAINSVSFIANIEIPIFDRNQGEIARTHFAISQADEQRQAAQQAVMTDVTNAFEAMKTSENVVKLYDSGYLNQAKQSLEISRYAFQRGGASLLDFLDAERSYRSTELAYRQALANYMLALEQLRNAVGTRNLP